MLVKTKINGVWFFGLHVADVVVIGAGSTSKAGGSETVPLQHQMNNELAAG